MGFPQLSNHSTHHPSTSPPGIVEGKEGVKKEDMMNIDLVGERKHEGWRGRRKRGREGEWRREEESTGMEE